MDLHGVKDVRLGERPFKFQAAWLLHAEFHSKLEREWVWQGGSMGSLKRLTEKLCAWNKDTFGNIFCRRRQLRNRLERVVKAFDKKVSVGLLKLERKLKRELANVMLQEESLWMQKSRIDWHRMGDRNTKNFTH